MLELNFTQTLGSHCLTLNETLPASGITAIFGVSGAGKTSLINAISGLTRPQSGRIVLNDRVLNDVENKIYLSPDKRRIGYVFQDARLFPHYSVRGNLRYGMAKSMAGQFDKLVALLGIEPLLDRLPGGLSGGERAARCREPRPWSRSATRRCRSASTSVTCTPTTPTSG